MQPLLKGCAKGTPMKENENIQEEMQAEPAPKPKRRGRPPKAKPQTEKMETERKPEEAAADSGVLQQVQNRYLLVLLDYFAYPYLQN